MIHLSNSNIMNFKVNDLKFPKFFWFTPQHSHLSILLRLLINTKEVHDAIIFPLKKENLS